MKKYLFWLFSLMLWHNILLAQPVNNQVGDVVMPPPNAASLGKYGDIPVSTYTGIPSIGIPIHTLKEGSLSLPISLSYHAGGVKVGEPASWVGLGWSLQAGGMISRTVQGRPDESASGWFSTGQAINSGSNMYSLINTGQAGSITVSSISTGNYDAEPDIFSFSVGGASGKFYFPASDPNNLTKIATVIPQQDVKITCTVSAGFGADRIKKFTITTADGNIYEFGDTGDGVPAIEITQLAGQFQQAAGWYLKQIRSADDANKINLFYTKETYSYRNRASSSSSNGSSIGGYYAIKTDVTYGYRLDKIETTTDKIIFISSITNREDIDPYSNNYPGTGAKKLDRIQIQAGTYCKEFRLSQDYFRDNSSKKSNSHEDNKLRLNQLQEVHCTDPNFSVPPHVFSYYKDATVADYLPNRLSSDIDHWGYFNGADNPKSAIYNIPYTKLAYMLAGDPKTYYRSEGVSNRESNEAKMQLGTLNKITYPTGGSTTFELGANEVYQPTPIVTLSNVGTADLFWGSNGVCGVTCTGCPIPAYQGTPFTVTIANTSQMRYRWDIKRGPDNNTTTCCVSSPSATIKVFNTANNQYIGSTSINHVCTVNNVPDFFEKTANGDLIDIFPNLPVSGTFRFEITGGNAASLFSLLLVTQTGTMNNAEVGGLRVEKITTNDGTNTPNMVKNYTYNDINTGKSTAVLQNKPKYGYVASVSWQAGSSTTLTTQKPIFVDYSVVPLGSFEGYHIGYELVRENNNGNGSTTYKYITEALPIYSFNQNIADPIPYPPAKPKVNAGNLIAKTDFNALNQTVASTFNVETSESYVNDGTDYRCIKALTLPVTITAPAIFWTAYNIRNKPYRLASTTSIIDNITTTTAYTYGSSSHLQPTKTTVTNSDGKVTETQMDYSFDVADATVLDAATKARLQSAFILTPIETRTLVAGNLLSGSRTIYKLFDNASGVVTSAATSFPRPSTFYNYERTYTQANPSDNSVLNTGTWVLKGTIDSYTGTATTGNKAGMPQKFTKVGWLPENYTWNTAGLITQRAFNGWTWNYAYHPGTTLVSKMTNPDGQFVDYTYDKLMRLLQTSARNGAVKSAYTYTYPTLTNGLITTFGNVKQSNTFTAVAGSPVNLQESLTYFDGLGRNIQAVKKGSFNGLDQISAVEYDNQGRVSKSYETFAGGFNTGNYQSPTGKAHTLTEYYADPLSRTWKVTPPSWHPTITEYGTNAATSSDPGVTNFNFASNSSTAYPLGSLIKTTVIDANGNRTISFKDKKGRLVCMRKSSSNGLSNTDTYYLYDDKDRLVKVITPGAAWTSDELNYYYNYQANDLIARKKVPGKVIELFQYNTRDLPALYQDGFLRNNLRWMATAYDDFGRMTIKGINSNWNKDALTFTNRIVENIYGTTAFEKDKLKTSKVMQFNTADPVVTPTAANAITTKAMTYDTYGRISKVEGNNHLNTSLTAEVMNYSYDNADNILTESRTCAHTTGPSNIIVNTRTFDAWARLTGVKQSIDGATPTTINAINYTEKNQVANKIIGGGLQTVDYAYLPNGLLRSINGTSSISNVWNPIGDMLSNLNTPTFSSTTNTEDLFREDLQYDAPTMTANLQGVAQKNGNISQAVWQVKGRAPMAYGYTYDYLDRMTDAKFSSYGISGTLFNNNYFNEKPTYDARGNITSLQRQGMLKGASNFTNVAIDNLTYTYKPNTNQIQSLVDNGNATEGFRYTSTAQYTYDNNGNVLFDPNKNLTISYNHLNLPSKFTFGATKFIEILYDAAGQKLRKKTTDGTAITIQDYLGGIELKNNRLESIYNEEGRAFNTTNATQTYPYTWRREYNLKDHLGNTRVVFCDKNNNGVINDQTEILQETHYYPFGMAFNGAWYSDAAASKNKYLYNGKELNDDFGLNLSDYGARWYDASIGRWWSIDPLAEIDQAFSPYNYVMNNPLKYVDYFGMFGGEPTDPIKLPEVEVKAKRTTSSSAGFYSSLWSQYDNQSGPNPYTFSRAQNEKIAGGITTVLTAGVAAEAGAVGYGFQGLSRGGAFLWNQRMAAGRWMMRNVVDINGAKTLWKSKIALSLTSQGLSGVVSGNIKVDAVDIAADVFLTPLAGAVTSAHLDVGYSFLDGGFGNGNKISTSTIISSTIGFLSNRTEGLIGSALESSSVGLSNMTNYIGQFLQKIYFTAGNDTSGKLIEENGKK